MHDATNPALPALPALAGSLNSLAYHGGLC